MKHLLLIFAAVYVTANKENDDIDISPLSKGTFRTQVDHFSPQSNRSAKFEYLINHQYYQNGGPFFIHINTGDISPVEWLNKGLVLDVAKQVNGAALSVHIRFFGNNRPTENTSYDNLKYLTVEQILADISHLVHSIRTEYRAPQARIILCGSGFGGTLAAWSRQKFPHLIYAAWSSSGIFERILHTKEPYEALSRTIREQGGAKCATNVAEAFDKILEKTLLYELEYLRDIFNLCDLLWQYNEDIGMFYNGLIDYIITNFNGNGQKGIQEFCNDMTVPNANDTALDLFGKWVRTHYAADHCLDYDYLSVLNQIGYINWESPMVLNGARQNLYLKCTQLAHHATTVNGDTLFARTIAQDFYRLVCQDTWYRFDYMTSKQAVEQLNQQYGGKNMAISRAIFSNGKYDLNYAFGITQIADGRDTHVINIPNVGKSSDFWEKNESDTVSVGLAKDIISAILMEWSLED